MTGLLIFIAGSALIANMAFAGAINYSDTPYNDGGTLTTEDLNTKFNEIKSAVNDNDNNRLIDKCAFW